MSRTNFKVIIHSKRLYYEVEISKEIGKVCIGTTSECGVRFNKKMFFADFKIAILWENDVYKMECDGPIYMSNDGILKHYSIQLVHGTQYKVYYLDNNAEVFTLDILYDFDEICDYEKVFPLSEKGLMIGGKAEADIFIKDDIVGEDYILIKKSSTGYIVDGSKAQLGVYINGKKYTGREKIGNRVFVMLAGYNFYLKDGMVFTSIKSNETLKIQSKTIKNSDNVLKYPKFNRTSRQDYQLRHEEIEILDPMEKADEPEQNYALMLVPVAVSLVLTILIRGVMGNGGAFIIYSICTMIMGAIMSVITAKMSVKKYRQKEQARVEGYQEYIAQKEDYIKMAQEDEKRIMEEKYLSLSRELELVQKFDKRLFEKDIYDEDFLTVRLGTGDIISECKIKYKPNEIKNTDDELTEYPQRLFEKYYILPNVPIISGLRNANAVGVIGTKDCQNQYFKKLVLEIVLRHFYKEVKTVFLLGDNDKQNQWIKWLKTTEDEEYSRLIANDDESRSQVLEFLYDKLTKREKLDTEDAIFRTYYVVFVTDSSILETHPVKKFIQNASTYGFVFLFFEEYEELLPYGISQIIKIDESGNGKLIRCENCDVCQNFTYQSIEKERVEKVAEKLAPLEVAEISLEGSLTKNISMYRLLGIQNITDIDLKRNWEHSQIYKSMAAPLGVKTTNEVVYLDLHEKAHGPHGLVAGTTGSGKSEILQSYILSMAILFHPYEVSFMIIDFKGGGMVNQFRNLPHLIGAITNIDGKEINRSLLSIKAELKKRQELFAVADVNHINAYIRKYKAGECHIPLPHLILIVDEFAELKSEQPDFMKELISAARIGRSLGVHLILATQKPSGVVDEQIWSNSKFKLCLKVQNQNDSNEVIKSPLAAEIREPGRAYLQVGNNEIFDLFQSAYSGASVRSEEIDHVKPFKLYEVDFTGKRKLIFEQRGNESKEAEQTQLDAIVEYINSYCATEKIEKLPNICLAPLTDYVAYDERKDDVGNGENICVPLGIYDDPAHQIQEEVHVDITNNNIFILGSAQYGKTNILQTIIRCVAENYTPKEVNFYILDFASMILKNFEKVNHVGGVVFLSEDEKMKTFMKMMLVELKERKVILSDLGISSFTAYKEAGYTDLPQIVILIDNFAAFRDVYETYEDGMLNLLRDGVSVGITIIATNGQTNGLGYKFLATFSKRISLYCNDSGEYSMLFDRCRMVPNNLPGRGLIEIERTVYEYQNYLSFKGEKEIERVENMKKFAEKISKEHGNIRARQIPEIPLILTERHMIDSFAINRKNTYVAPIGIDFENIEVVSVDMNNCGVLGIMGREKSGKSNMVEILLRQLRGNLFTNTSQIYILDDGKRQMQRYEDWGNVKAYTLDAGSIIEWIEDLHREVTSRYTDYMEDGEEILEELPLLVYVIQNVDAIQQLCKDAEAMKLYKEIIGKYKDMKWCIIYSAMENVAIPYSGPEVLKLMKETKNLLFFDELVNMKYFEVTNIQVKAFKKEISLGDAFYFKGNDIVKIRTIKMEGER